MKLHFNADLARERLSDGLVRQELDRAKGFYRQLAALTPESADWGVTGWLHCEEAAMQRRLIAEKAREIRQCADVFVLVGVGGSNQSARAMIEALKKAMAPRSFTPATRCPFMSSPKPCKSWRARAFTST